MENLNSFEYDLLDRQQVAVNLTNIIKFKSDLRVLAIDSSWGTGKTTFINMWKNMIDSTAEYKTSFETMYFNAWENDYISDPLSSLLSELERQIKSKDTKVKSLFEKGINKAKPYAKIGGQIVLKHLTRGVLDSFELKDNLEEDLMELSNKVGEIAFKEISISKQTREILKHDLIEFQNSINKKVIIFIDELDRCKPTFAVELLETIKHIFNLDNYVFVISLDKEQLSHSIKTLYGQGMDSDGYLRRFFDLEYNLPNNNTLNYIKHKNKQISSDYKNTEYLTRFFEEIFIKENYSLRDINKVYEYISVLLPNIFYFNDESSNNFSNSYFLVASYLYAFFINLRFKYSGIYKNVKSLSFNPNEDYIKSNLITFDVNSFNLKFSNYHDTQAKKVLSPVLPLYLELLHKVGNSKNYYYSSNEEMNRYTVGIKDTNDSFYHTSAVELLYFISDNKILSELEFINNFKI
ncbi:KAP family P-loop NTPase fold protein [Clostridium nigeriense]|uniref:KAP family P-loop NTPase fold protein n=1 Tax=Clostridium nigeriense TaxID=1805470 RepID=UPI003D328FC7